jgi:hypothetical protein
MLRLRVVQARYGDCMILESGYGKRRRHVLVDGGPSLVYKPYLRGELSQIAQKGGKIDLMVLTHVDNDHVVGLLQFIDELNEARASGSAPLIEVVGMWHNAFSKFLSGDPVEAERLEEEMLFAPITAEDGEESAAEPPPAETGLPVLDEAWLMDDSYGIKEGHNLQAAEKDLNLLRNYGFRNHLIRVEDAPRPVRVAGMRITILGPSIDNLENLRQKWVRWLTKEGLAFGAGQKVTPDDSEANLSSIMFLAESGQRRILMTGDGLGSDVVAGLETAGLMPPGGTFKVDILKLPHHGSARNAVGALFDRVLADTYVISADGKHGNPDYQTLEWLVNAACRQGRDIHIFATNPTPTLERLVQDRPPAANHYRLTIMERGASSALL